MFVLGRIVRGIIIVVVAFILWLAFITYFWRPIAWPVISRLPIIGQALGGPSPVTLMGEQMMTSTPPVLTASDRGTVAQPGTVGLTVSDLGARLCDSDIATGLNDPAARVVTSLTPGYGLVLSMDPGSVTADGRVIASSGQGMILGIRNDTRNPVEISVSTGWNPANGRHNVYICRFVIEAIQGEAATKQQAEKKPVFRVIDLSQASGTQPATATQAIPLPSGVVTATGSNGAVRLTGHFPVGTVVQIQAGEVLWLSSDPGQVCVNTQCYTSASGYTLTVAGPASVDVKSPKSDLTSYVVGPNVDVNNKDGKALNLTFRNNQFVSR